MPPRRPASGLGLILALVTGFPFLCFASAGSARAAATGASRTPEMRLESMWFERKAALDLGDTAAAAGKVDEMTELVRAERLDRVTWLARGFAYEGYEHLREGNYERSREAFDLARRFDPRLPEAQTGYAWAALRAGRGVGLFLEEYRRSLTLRWEAFRREGTANFYLLGIALIWIAAIVLALVFLIRYQAMLRHDVAEGMPRRWAQGASRLAGWIWLLAPLLVWIGGAWVLFYWCVIFAKYMSPTERILAVLLCAGIALTPMLAAQSAVAADVSSDPVVVALDEALQGGYGARLIGELQRAATRSGDNVPLRLLLANTYERAGLSREAFEEYQRITKSHPDDSRALNNVGNLYMKTGQVNQAIVFYTRAVEADARQPIFYYNLALAQSEALRLADAEASIRRLQELDPQLASALVKARGTSEETPPITAMVTAQEVRAQAPAPPPAKDADWIGQASSPIVIGAIAAIVLVGWRSLRASKTRAQICVRCGEPFCGRCKREIGAKECCAQCIHLFVKRDAIAPDVRNAKMNQVERFGRRWKVRTRALSFLLPGSGHLVAGRTIVGMLLLAGWLVPLTALLLRGRLLLAPSLPVLDGPELTTLAAGLLMAALWAAANLLAPKQPS